jgi:acylphosphatase
MSKNQNARLTAHVTGLVQGVSFRWFIQRNASGLGLAGYVKNEPDGSVSFVAEGSREALERLLDLARSGPSSSAVENVETEWSAPTGEFYRFEIRY